MCQIRPLQNWQDFLTFKIMHSVFHPSGKANLSARIEQLNASSERKWGTMTVEEMLWHLRSQLEMAAGVRPQKTFLKSVAGLPPVRWLMIYLIPWPKGLPTAPEMKPGKVREQVEDFEAEKQKLLQQLSYVEQAQLLLPHPVFGALSKRQWGYLIWKHFNHHFQQFGV